MNISAWDPRELEDSLDGNEALAAELVALFVGECPAMLARVRDAVERGDSAALGRAAHAIKGAVSTFTQTGAHTTAARLELAGRAGDLAAASADVATLQRELDTLFAAMREPAAASH